MARFQVGEVFSSSFGLAFRNFMTFLRTQGVLVLALAAVNLAFTLLVYQSTLPRMMSLIGSPSPDPAEILALVVPMAVGGLAFAIVALLVAPASYGIGLRVADAVGAGPSDVTLGQAWADAKPRYGAMLALFLLFIGVGLGLGVAFAVLVFALLAAAGGGAAAVLLLALLGIGLVALVVWLVLRWFPSPAILFFEGVGPAEALRRAAQVTKGSRGAILGVLVLVFLSLSLPASILGAVIAPQPTFEPDMTAAQFEDMQPGMGQQIASWVVTTAFSLMSSFVGACAMVLVYRKLTQPSTTEPPMGPITLAPPPGSP